MFGTSHRIGRIAGIRVGVSAAWLLIVVLFTLVLGAGYYPTQAPGLSVPVDYALGLASILLLFASILAHEFGHAIVARRCGIEVEEIDLWLLGGVSRMKGEPRRPRDELRYAAGGPAVTAAIAVVFGVLALVLGDSMTRWLRVLIDYEAEINLLVLGVNVVPAFPLDGGRVLRAALWWRGRDLEAATGTAAAIGRGFGWVMIVFGVLAWVDGDVAGMMLALVGGFIVLSAGTEIAAQQAKVAVGGLTVGALMTHPAVTLPEDFTVLDAEGYFERMRLDAFPLVDRTGVAVGLLEIADVERTAPEDRHTRLVGEVADRDPDLFVGRSEDSASLFTRQSFIRTGHVIVVDRDRRPVGIVSRSDLARTIRARRLRDGADQPPVLSGR